MTLRRTTIALLILYALLTIYPIVSIALGVAPSIFITPISTLAGFSFALLHAGQREGNGERARRPQGVVARGVARRREGRVRAGPAGSKARVTRRAGFRWCTRWKTPPPGRPFSSRNTIPSLTNTFQLQPR